MKVTLKKIKDVITGRARREKKLENLNNCFEQIFSGLREFEEKAVAKQKAFEAKFGDPIPFPEGTLEEYLALKDRYEKDSSDFNEFNLLKFFRTNFPQIPTDANIRVETNIPASTANVSWFVDPPTEETAHK